MTKIQEHDCVTLVDATGRWPAGTEAAVVWDRGEVKLIEISDDRGQELDMFFVPEAKLRLDAAHQ